MPTTQQTNKKRKTMSGTKSIYKKTSNKKKDKVQKLVGIQNLNKKEIKAVDYLDGLQTVRAIANVAYNTTLITGYTTIFLAQSGVGFWNRVGNKTCIKNISIEFDLISVPAALPGNASTCRYLVIYDKTPSGSAPVISTILASVDQTATKTTNFASKLNLDYGKRFVILRDKHVTLNPWLENTSADGVNVHCKEFIRKDLPNTWSGNANPNTIANVTEGALYFILFCDDDQSAYMSNFMTRVRYYDN